MSKFFFFSLGSIFLQFNFPFLFFPSQTLEQYLEWPWSEECLTLGDDVTKLFARFIVQGYPFVTPSGFRVIDYPCFYFGLGMHQSCASGGIGRLLSFFEGGKQESIGGCFGGKIQMDMGDFTCYIIRAHLRSFEMKEKHAELNLLQ